MIRASFFALVLLVPLAACGSRGPGAAGNATANTSDVASPGALADKLAALPQTLRDGAFMRAISDAGFACQKIEQSADHAPISGAPAWAITCDHDNHYVALALPGDRLQIVPGTPKDTSAVGDQRSSKRSNS